MEVVVKNLSELHEFKNNIRRHGDRQLAEYKRSLEMFGQIRPLVVDEDGMIIAGNGMFEALVMMGRQTAECYVVNGLTEAQKKKMMLADNKIFELGTNNNSAFDDIVKSLDGDFDVPGFDRDFLAMFTATPDEWESQAMEYGKVDAPELIEEPHNNYGNTAEYVAQNNVPQYEYTPARKAENARVETEAGDTRPFVICPHCGEKVWL